MIDLYNVDNDTLESIKRAPEVTIPKLYGWNYEVCPDHPLQENGMLHPISSFCSECGIPELREHQRKGIAWLYLRGKGVLADSVGTGKTIHALGLLALMRQRGELNVSNRAIIVVKPQALGQWEKMVRKCVPNIQTVVLVGGNPSWRHRVIASGWELALVSYATMLRDKDILSRVPCGIVMYDDVDPIRNTVSKTHRAARQIAKNVGRVIIMHGTPLQKRLLDVYAQFSVLGIAGPVFGTQKAFDDRYVRRQLQYVWRKDKNGRAAKRVESNIVGYKNVDEFKEKIEPFALRRTDADIHDVNLPSIQPNPVYLELYPRQRERYEELRAGVLRILTEEGEETSRITAMGKVHAGARICVGLEAVDGEEVIDLNEPETSCKLDWLSEQIEEGGAFDSTDKVVVFGKHISTIQALQRRLTDKRVGHVTVWGRGGVSKDEREATIGQFWKDPNTRFLLGTASIEQSLNLQVARHIVCLDTILNPARMEQLVGRIRRDGSPFETVHVHYIWTVDTQESGYERMLSEEQAIIDYVWDEETQLFDRLPPTRLLQLIAGEG